MRELLPYVDEHQVEVSVPPEVAWHALLRHWERPLPGWFARLLGCQDVGPIGPGPLAQGSSLVGFHVDQLVAPVLLVLAGSHRFARYLLIFHLEPTGQGGTRLRAETRAEFPGFLGTIYRLLVIRSGLHILVTRFLLAAIGRRARTGVSGS